MNAHTKFSAAVFALFSVTSITACDSVLAPATPSLSAPAVVQVENSPEGRPQSGLGEADVVYEYVAEGGIGRFSLLFFDHPAASQKIGPVRSARTVTLQIAEQYQGYLVYSGASTFIGGQLESALLAVISFFWRRSRL